jgi:4'-phosphopantetheinyl transferase
MEPATIVDAIDIWLVRTDLSDAEHAYFLSLLDRSERLRYGAIPDLVDARRFVATRGVTRSVVAGRLATDSPRDVRWTYGPNGKPAVAGADLQVNMSHSGHFAMVAVSAARSVGVDLQGVLPGLDVVAMAARYYPAAEAREITGPSRHGRFAELWARKEALVKAAGGRLMPGLAVPVAGPSPVLVAYEGAYRIADLDVPAGFRAAVALAGHLPFEVRRHEYPAG